MPSHYGTDIYDMIFSGNTRVDYDNPKEVKGTNLGSGNFFKKALKHFKRRRSKK
jgi:hypothetical protein